MSEVKRKILRMAALIFPGLYLFFDKTLLFYFLGILSLLFMTLEVLRVCFPSLTHKYFKHFSWLAKERERGNISGTTWLIWGSFLTILFFEKKIAILALLFLILGDAAAALVRLKTEKIQVWGRGVEGSFTTLVVCLLIGVLLKDTLQIPFPAIILGALITTFMELIPIKIKNFYLDDNFSMSLAAGFIMTSFS